MVIKLIYWGVLQIASHSVLHLNVIFTNLPKHEVVEPTHSNRNGSICLPNASLEPGFNTSLQSPVQLGYCESTVRQCVVPISAPGTGRGRRLDRGGITRLQTGFNTPGDGGLAHARLACVRAHTSPSRVRDTTSRQCQRALSRVPL